MIVFPTNFIVNLLSFKILTSLYDILGNKEREDYSFRWLFELLENERFIDLGEIKSSQHWARRAYDDNDNDNRKYSKVTKLEKKI